MLTYKVVKFGFLDYFYFRKHNKPIVEKQICTYKVFKDHPRNAKIRIKKLKKFKGIKNRKTQKLKASKNSKYYLKILKNLEHVPIKRGNIDNRGVTLIGDL